MALLVFFLLAVSLLLVLLSGADVYQRLAAEGQDRYRSRTATQYVTTRIRQAEAVLTEDFSGVEALVFPETVDGKRYLTRVYCHDGYLKELFTPEEGSFLPEDGEKLLELDALTFSFAGNCLSVHLAFPNGSCRELTFFLPQREEGGHEA